MKSKLIEKLNELSQGKYDFLKPSYIHLYRESMSVEIGLIYPEQYDSVINSDRDAIAALITRIIDTKLKLKVKLIKSYFLLDIFVGELHAFLEAYPSVEVSLKDEYITVEDEGEGKRIVIGLEPSACRYVIDYGIHKRIKEHFSFKYWQPLSFEFRELENQPISTENIDKHIKRTQSEATHLEKEGGRFIKVPARFEFIGALVEGDAAYICDARINEKAIHCGTVEELMEIPQKPKPPEETTDKVFYKFKLRDYTGVINCLYFPTPRAQQFIHNLCDGKTVILSGRTVVDTFNNDGRLLYMVKNINLCTMPERFKENRKMRKVADEYLAVKPKPYAKSIQGSLFDMKEEVPNMLKGKRFCVFDLETTGLDPKTCEIMEIGAVTIEDGEIKDTFSSFISIENNVPEKITQLTGIDDSHLVGQPPLKDVLADFMKFSDGHVLVAQNISFDYSFISLHGEKHHIYYDNEKIDTMVMARKYLKNMKNYTLKSITSRLGITNESAHRALSDAIATAQAFIKLAKLAE